jgi:hypothetical protein
VVGAQSVGQYLEEWVRDAVEPSVSPSTHDECSWAVNEHIKPAFGGAKLDARRIQALYAPMAREGYAYSTRREIHVTLKMALSQALKWDVPGGVRDLALVPSHEPPPCLVPGGRASPLPRASCRSRKTDQERRHPAGSMPR